MTTPAPKNGCHNRAPYRETSRVQDGSTDYMTNDAEPPTAVYVLPRIVEIPFRMSRECNYTHTELGQRDERCAGCRWRHESEQQ